MLRFIATTLATVLVAVGLNGWLGLFAPAGTPSAILETSPPRWFLACASLLSWRA
jgi:hypothetical protein